MKEIPLANGKGVALVDDEDYELVSRYKWWMASYQRRPGGKFLHYAKAWYKDEQGNRTQMSMHRFLMKPDDSMEVDHRDNNGLNNQRDNLRICDRTLNQFNTRPTDGNPYKGVEKKRDRYSARIKFGGVRHNLGCFDTAEEAAIAYDMKAYELAGDFAYLNFPDIVHETLKKEAENEQEKE